MRLAKAPEADACGELILKLISKIHLNKQIFLSCTAFPVNVLQLHDTSATNMETKLTLAQSQLQEAIKEKGIGFLDLPGGK